MSDQGNARIDDIVIERDVDVPMRDGARLNADVFRPKGEGRVPALLNMGPTRKTSCGFPRRIWKKRPTP